MKKNFIDVVTSLAKDIAAEYSCSLVDVEYKKEEMCIRDSYCNIVLFHFITPDLYVNKKPALSR